MASAYTATTTQCSATTPATGTSEHRRKWSLPPWAEFLARTGLQVRRRLRGEAGASASGHAADTIAAVDAATLRSSLHALGIHPGDVLMVHSDAGALERAGWDANAFIDFLLEYLGPQGTLAMPTHPVLSSDEQGVPLYDLRRSPSSVGIVTEVFRRRKGVQRSAFPYSAAAAIGPAADELIPGHAKSRRPHDEQSPYARLGDLGGKVLCVGCPLVRMTVLHVAEDKFHADLGIPGFHESRQVRVRAGQQETQLECSVRSPWLWWFLALSRWQAQMHRQGFVRETCPSGLALRAADAAPVIGWMHTELLRGRSLYPLAGLNRWIKFPAPISEDSN